MDFEPKLYLMRAEDEFLLANKDLDISINKELKSLLGIPKEKTFFYSVITHAYYSIFYAAKSYLFSKGIKTRSPEEHKKTYEEFSKIVIGGDLDRELLLIYEEEMAKADSLLKIFKTEKAKRGNFTYNIKSEANVSFAQESIENARKFVSVIKLIIEVN